MVRRAIAACLVLAGCSQQPEESADNPLGLKMDEASAVGACLTPAEQRMTPEQMTPEKRRDAISCIQGQAARQIRPQLPQQVDPMTRLTDVTAEGTMLTYHQTVDVDLDSVPPGAIQQLEARVRTTVCAEPNMRGAIDMGGGYAYRWSDKAGRPIHAIQIDRCAGPAGAGAAPGQRGG